MPHVQCIICLATVPTTFVGGELLCIAWVYLASCASSANRCCFGCLLSSCSLNHWWLQGGAAITLRFADPPAPPAAPLSELEITEQTVKVIAFSKLYLTMDEAKSAYTAMMLQYPDVGA